MIPVAGQPLLEHILVKLREHGFSDVILALSLHSEQVRHYFGDGQRWDLQLQYSVSDEPLGTAGEVDNLRALLDGEEDFLVHYGDILTDLDIGTLAAQHLGRSADATLGLVTGVPMHAGVAEMDAEGRVTSFVEKPPMPTPCNAAVFALSRSALEFCGPGRDFSKDVFPEMIAAGRLVRGFVDENAYWHDIGRLSDLDAAGETTMMGAHDS